MSFRSRRPAKKLVIKDLKVVPSLAADYVEQTWAKVSNAVQVILSSDENTVTESKEALYRAVTDLCAQKQEAFMYKSLFDLYESYLRSVAAELVEKSSLQRSDSYSEATFLHVIEQTWESHCSKLRMIKNIFLHLDRSFILYAGRNTQTFASTKLPSKYRGVRSLWDMGLELFRSTVFPFESEERTSVTASDTGTQCSSDTGTQCPSDKASDLRSERAGVVYQRTVQGLLALIEEERKGGTLAKAMVRNLVRMLWTLGLYSGPLTQGCQNSVETVEIERLREYQWEDFESMFLLETDVYYEREAQEKLTVLSVSDYLLYIQRQFADEQNRLTVYLESRTAKRLQLILKNRLVLEKISFLTSLDNGAGALMAANRLDDLRLLYNFLYDLRNVQPLFAVLHAYTKSSGVAIVKRPSEEDETMVEKLLALKESVDSIVCDAFTSDVEALRAVRAGYKHFLNVRGTTTAELLAKFIDRKLRSGNKALSESQLEHVMDQVIELFRFIENKDVFQAFFRTCLSKRLLLGKSASMDMEKTMLSKLKEECGATFTKKLEAMFSDMNVSRDLMGAYRESLTPENAHDIDLTALILTMGVWPTMPPSSLNLPKELLTLQESFEGFYKQRYSNRVLTWQHAMGYCTVKAKFPMGEKILCMSQYQATVVLLFNSFVKLSFAEIKEATGMDVTVLKSTLQSLASGKVRVLLKAPKGRDVSEEDVFAFNVRFTAKLYRLKVNQIQLKETKEERDKTEKHILVERNMQVDAAIVRIMKTRKNLSHQMLLAEVFKQLRFPVQPRMVKQQIESLIEREYLERDDGDENVYRYLA